MHFKSKIFVRLTKQKSFLNVNFRYTVRKKVQKIIPLGVQQLYNPYIMYLVP